MKYLAFFAVTLSLLSCRSKTPREVDNYTGYVQGTTFHLTYDKSSQTEIRKEIDALLEDIEQSFSLYDSSSLLCKVNSSDSLIAVNQHFVRVFNASEKVFDKTNGAFNPAIYPLVKFWGYGLDGYELPDRKDSLKIDSLRNFTSFKDAQLIQRNGQYYLKKLNPKVQLDFSAIVKGYMVDELAQLLESKNIQNYLIEVGGETRAKGTNAQGKIWQTGIDKPIEDPYDRELMAIARLNNLSMATSGSYRKYYVRDGMKYSQTIDPSTGYPVSHSLVSVTVFAANCTEADAYATAFMVLGVNASKEFVEANPQLNAYLIYTNYKGDWEVYISDGLKESLETIKTNDQLNAPTQSKTETSMNY